MKITEVRIFPTESRDGKLKAFATMTFDDWFVVRNVKIIQGNNGLFVAMPSRKAVTACSKCQYKNVIGSKYCNQCGSAMPHQPAVPEDHKDAHGGGHMDIAHPITQECRVYLQEKILEAYNKEHGQSAAAKPAEERPREKQPEQKKVETEKTEVKEPEEEKPAEKEEVQSGTGNADIEL
ncbi:MAG: septation protein SpoVG family protein [Candidatus Omnitrophota bacterium]|nr:septation protein SpoVG family protein [Candidatus Omnitrophota bacterium]